MHQYAPWYHSNHPYQDRKDPAQNPKPNEYIGGGEALKRLNNPSIPSKQNRAKKSLKELMNAEENGENLSLAKVYSLESIRSTRMCDLRACSWLVYVFVLYHSNPHHFHTQLRFGVCICIIPFKPSPFPYAAAKAD